MERNKEITAIKENILILILIIFSLVGISLCVYLSVGDELWNFQNIYKMFNGFQIYKDANVICTPLFFDLGNVLFRILGANFLIFRVYNIIILTFFYFFTYKILRILGINKKIATICLLALIMFNNYEIIRIMANYNSLAIALSLFGIYVFIKNIDKINNKVIIIQSLVCFIIFLTKQNIGIFYFIAIIIFLLVKEKKAKKIKYIIKTSLIFLISCLIFILYLQKNGIFYNFLNYAVLRIKPICKRKQLC